MNRKEKLPSYSNISTRIYVSVLGILVGIGGILHGIYETYQGNRPTEGFVLQSIGAVTLLPNYLLTGIIAIIVGLFIIVWTIGFIQKKNGPLIFLILCIILFFVGGGVAQVAGFLIAWMVSMRIRSPLSWWEKTIPHSLRGIFAKLWLPMLVLGILFFISGFFIWLFVLPPGEVREITTTHYLLWTLLLLSILLLMIDIVFGFSRDIQLREK